jgi:hypothetical protein
MSKIAIKKIISGLPGCILKLALEALALEALALEALARRPAGISAGLQRTENRRMDVSGPAKWGNVGMVPGYDPGRFKKWRRPWRNSYLEYLTNLT